MNHQRTRELQNLAAAMQAEFVDIELLHQALIHTSHANESKAGHVASNQRLEFLGDAVLDLIVGEYLFRRFPNLTEGDLTKARAHIVCESTLGQCASRLDLGSYLLLGKGEAATGGRQRVSILADAFESVIGALYLDGGYERAAGFVHRNLGDELALIAQGTYASDYKTLLQERVQRGGEQKIAYEVVTAQGPDHEKTFVVSVTINGVSMGTGQGKSKKEAEQCAAQQAFARINN